MDILILLLAASATTLATGLGAIPVFFLHERADVLRPALWGLAAGVMTVASVVGLIEPALDEGSAAAATAGFVLGVLFLVVTRQTVNSRNPHSDHHHAASMRLSTIVFIVLSIHSLPEGLAIGSAYASATAGLSLFVIIAIGIHNIPEGTSIAIPMAAAGFSRAKQFWAAVATSVPQPIGALIAYLLVTHVKALMAPMFTFAAGAMLALVIVEMLPQAFSRQTWPAALLGVAAGAGVMLALSALLGV